MNKWERGTVPVRKDRPRGYNTQFAFKYNKVYYFYITN